MTEEQHKEMRDLYTFVLPEVLEIIPAAQQYGITQWCATDSPKDSWLASMVCLLASGISNYLRKHTYGGFRSRSWCSRILEGSQVITLKDISFRFYHTKINRKKMLVVKVGCVVMTRSTFLLCNICLAIC